MKVIYDISVLAQARRYNKARTGVFRVVDSLARGLAGSDDCTLTLCVSEGINEPIDFLADDPELGGVSLALSPSTRLRLWLYNFINKLTARVEINGSSLRSVPHKVCRKSLYHVAELTQRYGHVVREADLAATDIYHSPFYPIPDQANRAHLKRFLTVYDMIPILYPQFFQSDLGRLFPEIIGSLGPEDFVLAISHCTKNDLCNYRPDIDPGHVFVTHLAASELFYPVVDDARLAEVRAKYNIPEGIPYLLTLSTLEPRKNIEQVVHSFSRLVREQGIKDLRLVLVGVKGWHYDRIFEAIESFDIPRDSISLTGYVADEDLAALYSDALAFVYLSLYEGFGLPPLEAMQCGTPVITSNTSSLPEVVGEAGIMLDPKDDDNICQSMFDLYRNSTLRAKMSRQCLERAREFSWDRCTRDTLTAYKSALDEKQDYAL